jgi:SAM-dependent methyltransferase
MSYLEDPVEAYTRLAPVFPEIANRRRAYLDAVERLIAESIGSAGSLLDIGAGDGSRARRIAEAAGIGEVTLLEPSPAMKAELPIRAQELSQVAGTFDAITCLWNVLGHVFSASARTEVMRQCGRLLAPGGRLFIDVNHRYNIAHYGLLRTIPRMLKDLVHPCETNGDVLVRWDVCSTMGHVFTHGEFAALCEAAGLVIEKRFVVDYATGQLRRFSWRGNLLYVIAARPAGQC